MPDPTDLSKARAKKKLLTNLLDEVHSQTRKEEYILRPHLTSLCVKCLEGELTSKELILAVKELEAQLP